MRKLLIILSFPIFSFSQTYDELMSITNLDNFKKVMIENQYQFDKVDGDGSVLYGYGLVKDEKNESKSRKWGYFNTDGSWGLQFSETPISLLENYGDYDYITESITEKCVYNNITERNDIDYVTYECDENIDGIFGFVVNDDSGLIFYFPKK